MINIEATEKEIENIGFNRYTKEHRRKLLLAVLVAIVLMVAVTVAIPNAIVGKIIGVIAILGSLVGTCVWSKKANKAGKALLYKTMQGKLDI